MGEGGTGAGNPHRAWGGIPGKNPLGPLGAEWGGVGGLFGGSERDACSAFVPNVARVGGVRQRVPAWDGSDRLRDGSAAG